MSDWNFVRTDQSEGGGDESPGSKLMPLTSSAGGAGDDVEKNDGAGDLIIQELMEEDSTGIVINHRGLKVPASGGTLQWKLYSRHMQMIGIGGAVGTGLFIGSGSALQTGGPASCLIAFALMGVNLGCTMYALGEMAAALPVSGSFAAYSARFIDPTWGFAMGWNYWMQWLATLPLEIVAATVVIRFWDPNEIVSPGIWVAILLVLLGIINFIGVRVYAEIEYIASTIKFIAIIGFIICGIIIKTQSTPGQIAPGFQTWTRGSAFRNDFKGLCSVFTLAAFAFAGTELVGLAAAESSKPRAQVPKACKQIFWRIVSFYLLALFIVGLIVPADSPDLIGTSQYDPHSSPFVIAIEMGGITILPSIFNAVILIAVLSVGNSAIYGSSRTLCGMAQSGLAPKVFAHIDSRGRPLAATILSVAFGALAFLVYAQSESTIFAWLLSLSGLSSVFTWGSINVCHIRFRAAWNAQGKSLELLPWKSPLGTIGSYIGAASNVLVLITCFYSSVFPIGEGVDSASDRAIIFFQSYLAVPIVLAFYAVGWFFISGRGWVPLEQIDVSTGQREAPSLDQLRAERAEAAMRPTWKKLWHALF